MSDKGYQKVRNHNGLANISPRVRGRFLTGSERGHAALGGASPCFCTIRSNPDKQRWAAAVKTMPKRNGDAGDTEIVLEAPPTTPEPERSHVRLVAGDPPMLRLEINLYSWERGDSDIEVVLPHGGELSDLLQWALPEQRLVICGNLRARIHEELSEVFNILQESAG